MPAKKNTLIKRDEQYAMFLKGIRLLGFGMLESRTTQNRDEYVELHAKNRLYLQISANYSIIDANKDFFNASAKLRLTASDEKHPDAPVLLVECSYIAHFHCDECEITRQQAERFTESELRLVVWPYFRQFVNDMTARMSVQPILIPFSAVS